MQEQSDVGLGAGRPAVLLKMSGLGRVSFPCPWAWLGVQCPVAAWVPVRGYQQILKQQCVPLSLPPAQASWHGMLRWEAGFLPCTRAWPFEGSG